MDIPYILEKIDTSGFEEPVKNKLQKMKAISEFVSKNYPATHDMDCNCYSCTYGYEE